MHAYAFIQGYNIACRVCNWQTMYQALSTHTSCTVWRLRNNLTQLQRSCSCKCIEKAFVAGLILENVRCGREKHIWLSTAADLRIDARRDLDDIKAQEVDLHALNRQPYCNLSSPEVNLPDLLHLLITLTCSDPDMICLSYDAIT